jgi:DNA gyrase subunit A
VRRNKLSDFVDVRRSGIIAMKLGEGEGILGVETCTEADDVILTTAQGQCIRFPVPEVRVFAGRNSIGVRGINLAEGDEVISMAILRHFEITPAERLAYFRMSRAVRGESEPEEVTVEADAEEDATAAAGELSQERYAELGAAEQFILTVSANGYGKRTSSFEYRITRRGGKGIVAMAVNERNGKLVASFPVEDADQIILVTDGGQTIRMPVGGEKPIRIAGRGTQGVTLFDTQGEHVVSVERLSEDAGDDDDEASPAANA